MKIKLNDTLKLLLNLKFAIDYDDYEIFYAINQRNIFFRFILKDSNDQFMLIDFDMNSILLIRQLEPFYSQNSDLHLGFETVKSMVYFPNFELISFTEDNLTLSSSNLVMNLETDFLVYLQLCNFDELQQELAEKINHTKLSSLKMEPGNLNKGGFIIWK